MLSVKNPKTVDWGGMPLDQLARGNVLDVHFTYKINSILESNYKNEKQKKLMKYLINPLLVIISKMEFNGIDVSKEKLNELDSELVRAIMEVEDRLYSLDGVLPTDNLSSPDILAAILYGRDGAMELYPPDWIAKKQAKTCKETLGILLEQIDEELAKRG